MSEYEIALLDYGEKRGFWKYVKRAYVIEARMKLDFLITNVLVKSHSAKYIKS